MIDIKTIPDEKLRQDLSDSYEDIAICANALLLGVTEFANGRSVQERLDDNNKFVKVITAEIERRDELNALEK